MAKSTLIHSRANELTADNVRATGPSVVIFLLGAVFLAVSLIASGMLAWSHFKGIQVPGCAVGSACDQAARSLWPLVGVAAFSGLLMGWAVSRGAVDAVFLWIVRLGVVASAVFVGQMALTKLWCPYCIAVHAGNLAFWIVAEASVWRAGAAAASSKPVVARLASSAFLVSLILSGIVLGAAEALQLKVARETAQRQHQESVAQMIKQSGSAASAPATQRAGVEAPEPQRPPFTGRYRVGPENAPIRIVLFSDYQCIDCFEIERQVKTLLASRSDISVSAKHFPMCTACNKHLTQNMHPNACWAARAAEAAGLLRGNEGFWQMHHWLFTQRGSFTDASFPQSLRDLGYDPAPFIQLMQSEEPLKRVQADIEEAVALGLYFTPMVFINGVELRGFRLPNALINAVESLAASNPPPGSAAQDRPPLAPDKYIEDWRQSRQVQMQPYTRAWALGLANAPVKIVVWGNYQFAMTPELDRIIRELIDKGRDIQYTFRHYPVDQSCNSFAEKTVYSRDCWAAKAAEAAGMLGGANAFWKVHDWLLKNQSNFTDDALRQAAVSFGLDADKLLAEMQSAEVQEAITEDTRAGKPLIVQGIPEIYVNGKRLPRWRLEGYNILERVVIEAAK